MFRPVRNICIKTDWRTKMVTMLDCIRRSPETGKKIFENAMRNTDVLKEIIPDFKALNEIVLVGSGSSYNAIMAETAFIEKAAHINTHSYLPNDFKKKTVYNESALYIFVSQSGTSTLVKEQIIRINELGYPTAAVTDDAQSAISTTAKVHIPLEVGYEEFGYRTVGFSATMLTLKMIALRIGLENGNLTREDFDAYIEDGNKALAHHNQVVDDTLAWFEKNREEVKALRSIMYYGSGELRGIAVEGALKLMETPKLYLSIGFEAEDGIHGPCYGFQKGDAILFLNDGENDVEYADSMVRFSKNELGAGYMFGPKTVDEKDLCIRPESKDFREFEFAPAVQVIAYMMAIVNDVPVLEMKVRVPHISTKYFQTHRG